MEFMKKYTKILVWIFVLSSVVSCNQDLTDFLEKAPGVDVTEDDLFSSKTQLESYIASTYRMGIYSIYPTDGRITSPRPYTINSAITDEAEAEVTFFHTQNWNSGSLSSVSNPNGAEDFRFTVRWKAIRNAWVILERVDEVPDADQTYKDQVKGEMHFILGLSYFEMLKRYGGVPIVNKRFGIDDDFKLPRSSVEEVVNFIVAHAESAIDFLPLRYGENFRGRINKPAATMLKARTLLYAASPLFNSSQPYLAFGEHNDLISYGSFSGDRWKLAADAAKEALTTIDASGFALINDKGVDQNYKYVWEQLDNNEIILAEKGFFNLGWWQYPWPGIVPTAVDNSWGGVSVIHNFVRKYEKKDGSPQTWDAAGGDNLNEKYDELDNRFAQTVGYNGSFFNRQHPILETYQGGRHANGCFGGAWMKKLIPDTYGTSNRTTPNGILYRVAEAYLNLAEALNEYSGPSTEVYDAVNLIRERSGMPDLPLGLSQSELRERIRNERDIELAFEDHRMWDIRRWMTAENPGVMSGDFYGLKIYEIEGQSEFRYEPYIIETRTFHKQMYLHPFNQNEINKGYLVQNPGW
ncbi:putative outer membrane starch-binding protein [Algoriphagus antarcticus]|uniref:Putative outer membrane starch-binding protein n=2 Tax=Algoriphagus antarcticus TaxID=238540 RepID=A0A3E0DXV1_9BACT|nr:putative outer membrane starch-binding protein [Algoriphagus antarcticus]